MNALFGHLPDGSPVHILTLRSAALTARVLTLGATVQDLRLEGTDHPLVIGYPGVGPYLAEGEYVGALVGRFANRIGGARFTLDGVPHHVDANQNGRHMLHGGADGIHRHLWTVTAQDESSVTLTLSLPDGDMGFPGAVDLSATITLDGAALCFDLRARTDAPTPLSLADHGYFCLDGSGDIRGHHLSIAADHYLPVDQDLIPTGEIAPVTGTPFDFRAGRQIGAGYDHNFCLSSARVPLRAVARLAGQDGLSMTVETTEPGLQLYDGRHFSGAFGPYAGVALETQGWPDAVNQPSFPDCILRPGQSYRAVTRYVFHR